MKTDTKAEAKAKRDKNRAKIDKFRAKMAADGIAVPPSVIKQMCSVSPVDFRAFGVRDKADERDEDY